MNEKLADLQKDILNPKCDVVNVLRKAHMIAIQLKDNEFDAWIQNELNGYSTTYKQIPEYRNIQGVVKMKNPKLGWIPVIIQNQEMETTLTHRKLFESVGALVQYVQTNSPLYISFPGGISREISQMVQSPYVFESALFITKEALLAIIEQIKNNLWEWTIKINQSSNIQTNSTSQSLLLDLIAQIPEIKKEFKVVDMPGIPIIDKIYNEPIFITWRENVKAEIRKLKQDELVEETIRLLDGFTGWNDKNMFGILEAKLNVIKNNYQNYVLVKTEQESTNADTTLSQSVTNIYFQGDMTGSNIATGNDSKQEYKKAPIENKSWFEKYWFPLLLALVGAAGVIIAALITR